MTVEMQYARDEKQTATPVTKSEFSSPLRSVSTIDIDNICKTYPNGTRALNNVSLKFNECDFVVILGPSGAGKSTLLRCMNRLVEPTSGLILLKGQDITHISGRSIRSIRMQIGMIFQQFNLVRRLTVIENVLAGRLAHCRGALSNLLSLLHVFSQEDKEIAFECLKKVRIEDLAFQRADTLSGGQQQRVAIARTLAQRPSLILADEPVASLDPASAEIVMSTLLDIHEMQGIPVIVNLHQIDLGKKYGKRIVGMRQGEVVFDGLPEKLKERMLEKIYGEDFDCNCHYAGAVKEGTRLPASPQIITHKEGTPSELVSVTD